MCHVEHANVRRKGEFCMDVDSSSNKPITKVSFRIFSSELNPAVVNQILSLTADHIHVKGSYPRNDTKYSPYKHGMWLIDSKLSDDETISAHVENLLSVLEPRQEQILKLSESNTVDFSCTLFEQNGFDLSPDFLKRIANLGAALGVTVYP